MMDLTLQRGVGSLELHIEHIIDDEISDLKKRWMKTHLRLNLGASALIFAIELIIFMLVKYFDLFPVKESLYIMKYLLTPVLANAACIALQIACWKSKQSDTVKMYFISLGFVLTCFIAYSIHSYYSIIIFIFVIPVVLTVVYGDIRLTYIIAAVSFFLEIVSEFFVFWDPNKEYALSNADRMVKFMIAIAIQICLFCMCRMILKYEIEKINTLKKKEEERRRLEKEIYIDSLTGIYNRGALRGKFDDMMANRETSKYIFAMADIDRFKMTNDKLGHLVGDEVLRKLGEILREICTDGTAFRYGGDEFCFLYRDVPMEQVLEECKKIQSLFQERQSEKTKAIDMSISFGVAAYDGRMQPSQLVKLADEELYIAKKIRGSISVSKNAE